MGQEGEFGWLEIIDPTPVDRQDGKWPKRWLDSLSRPEFGASYTLHKAISSMITKKHALVSSSIAFLLAVTSSLGFNAYGKNGTALSPLSRQESPAALLGNPVNLIANTKEFYFKQPTVIGQVNSQPEQGSDSFTDEDISNFVVGISVILILPLFWKPTRKAIGLLNIIVGTVLTLTGIGALVGIPMILIGGVCLFI